MKFFGCRRLAGILLLFALTCGGCQPFSSEQSQKKTAASIQQLNDPAYTIAVAETGPAYEAVKKYLPKAKRLYLNAQPAYDAVKSGKADAYVEAIVQLETAIANGLSGVKILPEKIEDPIKIAVGISKNAKYPDLKDKLNAFIAEIHADGTFQDLYQRWIIDNNHNMPDIPVPEKADTKLVVGTTGLLMPFSYYEGATLTGTDVELARRFARWLGAELEFKLYNYDGVITAAVVGDVDCAMSNLFVTPERADKIDFSEPLYTEDIAILVRDDAAASESAAAEHKGYSSIADFNGKRIGVFTGSVHDQIVKGVLPKAECVYFDAIANALSALTSGKIDALAADEQIIKAVEQENSSVRHIDGYLQSFENAFIVSKTPEGDKIRTQLNEFIRSLKTDGTLAQILDIWQGTDESRKTLPDYKNYPDTNGTIRIAAESETPPFTYIKDRRLVGYEIDILARFCKAYGYRPEIDAVSFPAILPAVKSGKYMLGVSSFTITEERKESVNFSEPDYTGGAMLLVRKAPEELKASQSNTPSAVQTPAKYKKLADLRGKKIGIQTGVDSWARLVKKLIPDAEVLFFNDITGLATALESGKIDAFLENNVAMAMLTAVKKNITVLDENISEGYSCAVALRRDEKGQKLKAQWDEYITALKKDGKIDALMDKWTVPDESVKTIPDYESFPAPNGVLVMPTDGDYPPLSYYSENTLKGFEIDLAARFCEEYGYGLEIKLMSFSGIMPSIATGKCDFSVSAATVTEEHKETLMLSVPLYTYTTKIAVLASQEDTPAPAVKTPDEKHTALAGLNGKRIGVPTGVDEWAVILNKILPDAELVYYNSTADQIAALESGKIEAFPCDEPVLRFLMAQNKNIAMLDEAFPEGYDAGVVFPKTEKGRKLKAQWDEYITSLKSTGKLEALVQKWTGSDESAKTIPDYESLPSPNGVLKTATNGEYPPFSYFKNNKLTGLEVDLAVGFCQAYGYGLEYKIVNYEGILSSVQSGKSDFAFAALSLTEKHAENLLFSTPYHTFTTKIAVLASKKETPAPAQNIPDEKYSSLAALNGKRIGVATGVDEWADIVHTLLPASEVVYYNEWADLSMAMLGGKIAAFVCDTAVVDLLMQENKNIASIGRLGESFDVAAAFPKTDKAQKLKAQFDEFITAMKDSGELDSVISKWTNAENPDKSIPDYESLPAPNGVLAIAADCTNPPFGCYIGQNLGGFEIELAVKFCEAYGYGLKINVMSYEAILPAVVSGKYDFTLAALVPSEEHAENVLFSIPYYACATTMAVPADSPFAVKAPAAPASPSTGVANPADFAGKEIGVVVGTTGAETAAKTFPDAEIVYFDSRADVLTALKQGKIDAVCLGYNSERFILFENEDLAVLGKPLTRIDSAPVFAKTKEGRKLCAQFSEFFTAQRNNGFLDELDSIWFGPDNSRKTTKDYSSLPAVNGTLKMAADTTAAPFVYVKDNRILGYDVDCAVKFCEEYGYGLQIVPMNFAAIIPAVVSGKCDFGLCNISITEERKENILFSAPNILDGDAVLVRKADVQPKAPKTTANSDSFKSLAGKRIAVVTGTTHPQIAAKYVPTAELVYFNNVVDAMSALKAKKVDAVCTGTILLRHMMAEDDSVAPLGEQLTFTEGAPMFPKTEKGRKLCEQFSEFAKACWDNGTIKELESIWFDTEESKRFMKDYSALPSPNGVLRMAVNEIIPPCVYMKDNKIVGYDVDFAVRFCEAYGYGLKVMPMSFAGIIPALNAGRCDFGIGAITITEERKETMLFSYPNLKAGNVFAVRKSDLKPSAAAVSAPSPRTKLTSIADLSGKRIAVTTGMTHGNIALQYVPDAKLLYFDTTPDTFTALKTMKADAVCTALEIAQIAMAQDNSFALLGEQLTHVETAPIFPKTDKGRKLCAQFSEFIKPLWDDGTVQKVHDTWFGSDESSKTIKDYTKFPAPNGILRAAVDSALAPYIYVKDNKIVGYDIDLAARFCEVYGYGLEIVPMNFAGIIPALKSGRCDFGIGAITITEERKENVLFSEPFMRTGNVFVVRKSDLKRKAPAFVPPTPKKSAPRARLVNFKDLSGKKIAVVTGSIYPQITLQAVPDAELVYFNSDADSFAALEAMKVDAACSSWEGIHIVLAANNKLTVFGEMLNEGDMAPIFQKTEKGRKICEQFSEFVKTLWDNGTIDELYNLWFGPDDSKKVVKDYTKLPAPNGTLKLAANDAAFPSVYVKDNKIVGYDVDVIVKFCEKYGYGLEIIPMSIAGIIPAVVSGKADIGTSGFGVTEERKESVLFSYPFMRGGNVFLVRKEDIHSPDPNAGLTNISELNGKRIGVQTGTTHPQITSHYVPMGEQVFFDTTADVFTALKAGKVDAVCTNTPIARFAMIDDDSITMLGDEVVSMDCSPIFPKTQAGEKLREQFSEFIRSARKNGTLQEIDSIWFGKDDSKRTVKDYSKLPAPNGNLRMLTDPTLVPFAYVKNNRIVGYEVDCAVRFCEAYGYGLEVVPMNFGAIIPALVSGKYDFAACSIAYTPERAENVLYAESNLKSGYAFFVRQPETQKQLPKSQHLTPRQPAGVSGMRLDDLNGKKVGIILGANHDTFVAEKIPDAKIEYFSDLSTITLALMNGKISAFANTLPTAIYMTNAQKDLAYISEPLESTYTYSSFTNSDRGRKLCSEYEEFLWTLWADGTIDTLADKWVYSENESARTVEDYSKLPAVNGVLKMAIDTGRMPFAYVKDNRITGYDIELAAMFCKAKGYRLEVYSMDFAGILGSIKTGKCDLTGSITWTEERAETMLYSSVPNAQTDIVLLVMNSQAPAQKAAPGLYTSIHDLAGKKVAVQTGGIGAQIVKRFIPAAETAYFDTNTDMVTALKMNKVDAFCTDIPIGKFMMSEYDNMTVLGDPLTEDDLAAIFAKTEKGRTLCSKFNEFTKAAWENGTVQELESIWFGKDDKKRVLKDYSILPAPNGKLRMAVDPSAVPFTYMKDNRIIGYDMDFAVRFCEAYGYGLEIMPMNFAALIPAVMSGKCDFALSCITVTEERAENVLFSVPNIKSGIGIFVRKSDTQPQAVQTSGQYTTLEELGSKRIGVQTGTVSALLVEEKLPNAKIHYFDALSDTLIALKAGKIDALAATIFSASHMVNTNDNITILNQWLRTTDISPIFTKSDRGRKLCEEYSEFLKGLWEDGTIDRLNEIWLGPDESRKVIKDYSDLPAPNGTITLAVDTSMPPLAYVRDNRVVGYDIDLAVRFCEAKGYGLKVTQGNVTAILAEVMSGKSDLTMSLIYTEERAENALFPKTPSGHSGNVVVVLKAEPVQTLGRYNSIQELAGKKIGVQTGTTNDALVAESIPTAAREYFNTLPDALIALKTGKVDAICCSVYAARYMMIENDDIMYIEPMLKSLELAPIFSPTEKGRKLREEYSAFVKGLWADGTIKEIDSVWLGKNDSKRVMKDYSKLPAPNGILKMAAEPTDIPFVYMKDNKFTGYDVDIAVRFCEKYGYGLEVVPMNFSAVISSVNSGRTDFSASMHITPEREQSALFASTPTAHSGNVIVVMKAQPAQSEGEYTTFEELAGKTIAAQTGTPNGDFTLKAIPTANILYFDSIADIVTALKMHRIDAGAIALNAARFMMIDNEDLALMGKPLAELDAAPIFAKTEAGKKLCEQFNEFIKAQWDNGYLKELDSIWFSRDDSKRQPTDYTSLPATNGKLRMAVDTSLAPFAYVKDNKIVGYEIDFAAKFCKEYGYGLEVIPMNFGAIIAAVQSGKCDFASCTIAITPERAEQVLFASPNAKTGCALVIRKAKPKASGEKYSSIDDFAGKRIGVQTATRSPEIAKKFIPTATLVYQDSPADNLIALRTGKIDAVILADVTAQQMMYEHDDIAYLGERLTNVELKPIFTKTERGHKLCEEYSEFVKTLRDNGTLKQIESVWMSNDDSKKIIKDYRKTPDITPKGTLRMAVDTSLVPFVYVKDNMIVGYDIDIAARFCEAKGYDLEVVPMLFSGIIPAVNTGKCDFSCALTYTPERAGNVLFASTPNAATGSVIVVMKDKIAPKTAAPSQKSSSLSQASPRPSAVRQSAPSQPSVFAEKASAFMEDSRIFFEELKASFNRTFLREERWRLFIEGIINTMIITVLSIVFGTILGFIVYLLCRGGNVFANLLTRFFIWLIEGTPIVVLLMILYYIIFGKVDIPGIWVAVIAFTMTFGAGFFGMLKSGTGALDRGQTEAAYALGFTDTQTFFRVILPQAALHFMPAYKSSVVALIKATAIVGYIAVQDLTKMGDIVRSRTYEAFFPLIAVAAIYFVLAGMLNIIVGIIHNRIRPEKRTKDDILKGIDTHE